MNNSIITQLIRSHQLLANVKTLWSRHGTNKSETPSLARCGNHRKKNRLNHKFLQYYQNVSKCVNKSFRDDRSPHFEKSATTNVTKLQTFSLRNRKTDGPARGVNAAQHCPPSTHSASCSWRLGSSSVSGWESENR